MFSGVGVVDDFDPRFHQGAPPSDTPATGTEEKLAGLDVYVSGSQNAKAAVVLVSDIYGELIVLTRSFYAFLICVQNLRTEY